MVERVRAEMSPRPGRELDACRAVLDRRGFCLFVASGLALALRVEPLRAAPLAEGRVPFIGRLSEGGPGDYTAFRAAMRALGHPEVRIEGRFGGGDASKLPGLAAELVGLGVDVLWTSGSVASGAAKAATSVIPVVIVSADAVGGGLVASLAHPGGNLTGLTLIGTDLAGKRIEIMRRLVPGLKRVVTVTHGPNAMKLAFVADWSRASKAAADASGIDYLFVELPPDPATWDDALHPLARVRGSALFFAESPYFILNRDLLAEVTLKRRLPAMFAFQQHVLAGGLCAYGVTSKHIDERVAWYVSKILGGTKPAELPVEQPTTYELAIHRRTASALGLTIPRALLLQAELLVD